MPTPLRVVPIVTEIGRAAGHRLVALSLEVYAEFSDLRFARIDVDAERPLPRRVPAPESWSVQAADGFPLRVVDAVGRGDRSFSNGEVRLEPALPAETTGLRVRVELAPGHDPLEADLPLR